jgi:hypothetical protein
VTDTAPRPEEARESIASISDDDPTAEMERERASLLAAADNAPGVGALTGTHAAVAAPPQQIPTLRMPVPVELAPLTGAPRPAAAEPPPHDPFEELAGLLEARIATLEKTKDGTALARARLELALVRLGDRDKAKAAAEAALDADPGSAAAHALLRRLEWGRPAKRSLVDHLDAEISAAGEGEGRAHLLVERARVLEAAGAPASEVRAAWERAFASDPTHPAAQRGLEVALRGDKRALADHLEQWASSCVAPKLQAWLLTERAWLLDDARQRESAQHALRRALSLEPGLGPVRDANVQHAARYGDAVALVDLLSGEARIEPDATRAARLELEAASIAIRRLHDLDRARFFLENAFQRAPTSERVDRRVFDDLVVLYESTGEWGHALRVRRARMRFVTDPRAEAHELRMLATTAERAGDVAGAILALERVLVLEPEDQATLETLDRLLAANGRKDQRVVLWVREAARAEEPARRVNAFMRAAEVSAELGRGGDALRNLRAAFLIAPERFDVLDALMAQLNAEPAELASAEAKNRISVYQQAADRTTDPARRIHYLEKVALLWDELVGDPALAAKAYEAVLAIDPERRSAILGLASAAARAGDGARLARALEDEAAITIDGEAKAALLMRAARAVMQVDPERSLRLLGEVKSLVPDDDDARALVQRIHEEAGKWDLVANVIRERADRAADTRTKLARLLELARVHLVRRSDAPAALETLWAARRLDASHPAPVEEIVSLLERGTDREALRRALEELAETAADAEDRARWLVRAAELAEHASMDDRAAERLYTRALEATPGEELVLDRLARIGARTGQPDVRARVLSRAIDRYHRGDLTNASELVERAVAEDSSSIPALRTMEAVARALDNVPLLANALSRQIEVFTDPAAKLGACWSLAALVEWRLPETDRTEDFERILQLSPADRCALEAVVRRTQGKQEEATRSELASALRGLLGQISDRTSRMLLHFELAWVLEKDSASSREALEAMSSALAIDPASVTAATGTARLAAQLHDRPAGIAAAAALADLATDPKSKAKYLTEEAELLLASGERDRAAAELERALDADPDAVFAATRLAQLRTEEGKIDRLVAALRTALTRATNPDAVIPIGTELARIARDRLSDIVLAIDAMERVRRVAPAHIPSLLTLAELHIAQRTWPEAVDALEAVVAKAEARDAASKLTALFALASVYERVLSRPADAERALRTVLEIEPANLRALSGLVTLARPRLGRDELLLLLTRLAEAEKDPSRRRAVLLEVAEIQLERGFREEGEAALIEAAALAPRADLLARIAALHPNDSTALALSLAKLVARGRALGRVDAGWLATLGRLEVESLGHVQEGISHLQSALEQQASLHEARLVLAKALAGAGMHEEVIKHMQVLVCTEPFPPILMIPETREALELFEDAFLAERRVEQAAVVRELRALAGAVGDDVRTGLAARRMRYDVGSMEPLDRATLVTRVLPPEGRHLLLEVAAAGAGVEAKTLRTNLADAGVSARDRIGPRVQHPLRVVFDRVCRMLTVEGVELAVSDGVATAGFVIQDTPWLVLPATVADKSEPMQHAIIARLLARAALGVPWIEDLPPASFLAYTLALARQGRPGLELPGLDREVASLLPDYEARVAKGIGRRNRKQLAGMASAIDTMTIPTLRDAVTLQQAVARTEARAAFLVTGDLSTVVELASSEDATLAKDARSHEKRALAAVLTHAILGDVVRYALGADATALRWRLGTVWGSSV